MGKDFKHSSIVVTFEGSEHMGKTTHSRLLTKKLKHEGYNVLLSREPGGTQLGEDIRNLIMNTKFDDITPLAEMLLFAAARAQLCEEILKPALQSNSIIVLDRYADSSLAYQGYGRGVDISTINKINQIVTNGIMPDLTFLMSNSSGESVPDKFQINRFDSALWLHQKVKIGYHDIAVNGRWRLINTSKDITQNSAYILNEVLTTWKNKEIYSRQE